MRLWAEHLIHWALEATSVRVNRQGKERGRCKHSTLQDHCWGEPVQEMKAAKEVWFCLPGNVKIPTTCQKLQAAAGNHPAQDRGKAASHFYLLLQAKCMCSGRHCWNHCIPVFSGGISCPFWSLPVKGGWGKSFAASSKLPGFPKSNLFGLCLY